MLTYTNGDAVETTFIMYEYKSVDWGYGYKDENGLDIDLLPYFFDILLIRKDSGLIRTYPIVPGQQSSAYINKYGPVLNLKNVYEDIRSLVKNNQLYKLIVRGIDPSGIPLVDMIIHIDGRTY